MTELADDKIPVVVSCLVLGVVRQQYYRWLACPITQSEWNEAALTNAVFDAHRDDPGFGYRFLVDEVRAPDSQSQNETSGGSHATTAGGPASARNATEPARS